MLYDWSILARPGAAVAVVREYWGPCKSRCITKFIPIRDEPSRRIVMQWHYYRLRDLEEATRP